MATVAIANKSKIKLISGETHSFYTAEAIAKGAVARMDTSTGKLVNANATTAGEARYAGILLDEALTPNVAVEVAMPGALIDYDQDLVTAGLAFDADVFLGDTDGTLDTAAGTVSTVVGKVWAIHRNGTTAHKVLKVV